jgi:hypothetical protein
MKLRKQSGVVLALAALIAIVLSGTTANAQAYRVIHNFQGSSDGWGPVGVPAIAKNGDLFGVTNGGGTYDLGTVFKLTAPRTRGGTWRKTVLYDFPPNHQEYPTSLVIDKDGILYGAGAGPTTRGFIFRLAPPASGDGAWTYDTLYTFKSASDGSGIQGNLVFDAAGDLYGATQLGGDLGCAQDGCGTVFELKRPIKNGGQWRFSVPYTFTGTDGDQPFAGVVFDQKGNLYGTTNYGGIFGYGNAYRVSPPAKKGRPWTEAVLYSFDRGTNMGSSPEGPLLFDGSGNLYGTTGFGGDLNCQAGFGCGVVFELSPLAKNGNPRAYTNLYSFQSGSDGNYPSGAMVFDSTGHLYGITQEGGGGTGYSGIAFKLSPPAQKGDAWTETVLHRFIAPEGAGPAEGITWGKWNDLYGVTYLGGTGCPTQGCGTVFELQP